MGNIAGEAITISIGLPTLGRGLAVFYAIVTIGWVESFFADKLWLRGVIIALFTGFEAWREGVAADGIESTVQVHEGGNGEA